MLDSQDRINQKIKEELKISLKQVEETVQLLDEKNTIPFIARYRKEATGGLSDEQIRDLAQKLDFYRKLEEKKTEILNKLRDLGKLNEDLEKQILNAQTQSILDDIYLPYRPKRRTRASEARDKGLEPLASLIYLGKYEEEACDAFLSDEVSTRKEALMGARDIIAEETAENPKVREILRKILWNSGVLVSVFRKDLTKEEIGKYENYGDFSQKIKELPAHRILAINRGEKEKILKVKLVSDEEKDHFRIVREVTRFLPVQRGSKSYEEICQACLDGYKRLLFPSIENEIRNELKAMADQSSIELFSKNLKPYLMQKPIPESVVMSIDPGFRTGCKLAVLNKQGHLLDYATIYPTLPRADEIGSKKVMKEMVEKYQVSLIVIGNGTASRETEQVVADFINENPSFHLAYAIVNESGASIYSASDIGREEFPDLDVTIRGAISIGRRIQDPLAELVKIEPKHIGLGQYQHDVDQKELEYALHGVVEGCVNEVGVNINTASISLLQYVAGITKSLAKNIIAYRQEEDIFHTREEIKKVKGMGPKSFQQAAGFLRIPQSEEVLDQTAVHPESYPYAKLLLENMDVDLEEKSKEWGVGLPTLLDIKEELSKEKRDPRDDYPSQIFQADIFSMKDLRVGMELQGTVRNVTDFGAFVDVGVGQDGLVHISELGQGFYKQISRVLQVSDTVKVKVLSLDLERSRLELTMKDIKQTEEIEERKRREERRLL